VRAVKSCQHSFHAGCLEQWISRKAECPLCRVELPSLIADSRNTAFLEQVHNLITLLGGDDILTHLDKRYILTYVLIHGILKRFTVAIGEGGLRASSERIRQRLQEIVIEGTRPLPIDTDSRYALERLQRGVVAHIAERFACPVRAIRTHSHIQPIKAIVEAIPNIQDIWSTF
jgi:hypothetical protein